MSPLNSRGRGRGRGCLYGRVTVKICANMFVDLLISAELIEIWIGSHTVSVTLTFESSRHEAITAAGSALQQRHALIRYGVCHSPKDSDNLFNMFITPRRRKVKESTFVIRR